MTICMRGSVEVRSPLPSLVTITDDARLGDEQIGAGNADIGGEEFLAQHRARLGHEVVRRIELARLAAALRCARRKSASIVSLLRWMIGRDDVARRARP